MKRCIRLGVWATLILILVAMLVLFGSCWIYQNTYWWDRDQWNQGMITKAYILYYKEKGGFPSNLADLVKAGYLPETATWYKEPPGFFPDSVNFQESSYVVLPPESGNVNNLKMIGRKRQHNGNEEIVFEPNPNADIRDAIKQK